MNVFTSMKRMIAASFMFVASMSMMANTIAEVIAAGAQDSISTSGTVVATHSRGFLINDDTGYILVYLGQNSGLAIGDMVTVSGSTSVYDGLLEFSNNPTFVKTGTRAYAQPEPEKYDGASMDEYISAPMVKYVQYIGTLSVSGDYYNVVMDDAEIAVGDIDFPMEGLVSPDLHNKKIIVTGYLISCAANKYVNTMAISVMEYNEEDGDSLHKEIPIGNHGFEVWANGRPSNWVGVANSALISQSNDAKSGTYSIEIFGDSTINKRLTSQSYTLNSGTYTFSTNTKLANDTIGKLRLGYVTIVDGVIDKYVYVTDLIDVTTEWGEISCEFTLYEETKLALIIMNSKSGGGTSILIDDVSLTTTDGGLIDSGEGESNPVSIAEIIAAGVQSLACTSGTVVATYTRGFLINDNTGYILVYLGKDSGLAVGDVVVVSGSTSMYGGLLQFSSSPTYEKIGMVEYTHPEPEWFDADAMNSYLSSPTIKYVQYVGELSISGSYYDVIIDEAEIAQGSISYPSDGLINVNWHKKGVSVTGYLIGCSSNKYVNTMATSVVQSTGGIYYGITSLEDKTVEILSVVKDSIDGDFVLPTSFHKDGSDYLITSISDNAFSNCYSMTSITIPESVVSIGNSVFSGCNNLTTLLCLSTTPPKCGAHSFKGCNIECVYVPATSINSYKSADIWKDYSILPLPTGVSLTVNLPADISEESYHNMYIELVDSTGIMISKYSINGIQYTFNYLTINQEYSVIVKKQLGGILGAILNIRVNEDMAVTFDSLLQPQNLKIVIYTPDGTNVKESAIVTWYDADGNYLCKDAVLSGQVENTEVKYSVKLSKELALQYKQPEQATYMVNPSGNEIKVILEPFASVEVTGMVRDSVTGTPISDAMVTFSQKLNGEYSHITRAETDSKGAFKATLYDVPAEVTVAAADYISYTMSLDTLTEATALGDILMKPISGVVVSLGFTYRTSVPEGDTPEILGWYTDYDNVKYGILNKTTGLPISNVSVQYPQLVLLDGVSAGDELLLTVVSRTGSFEPTQTAVVVDSTLQCDATFDIVELGGIEASYTSTTNSAVVGILYNEIGEMVQKRSYSSGSLTLDNLRDGSYTLVTMGSSDYFNAIYNLSQLSAVGLVEGADYVKHAVKVESGVVSVVEMESVPAFDESKLYYTGGDTRFTLNKTSATAGNYLTLTGKIDFKEEYDSKVSDVSMVIDLPESAVFVDNSVMVGAAIAPYTLEGNRLTIPLLGNYTERVRFCIIPTEGGSYAPTAFAQFTIDGKDVLQPIGSAHYTVKDLSINVPSISVYTTTPVSGTAIGQSTIQIYDNDVLIGETTSLANGMWSATCELHEPYNLSKHRIHAKVITSMGLELTSEAKECMYDMNAVQVSKVTMINVAHPANSLTPCEYVTVFDFLHPAKSIPDYWYWPDYPEFTFLIEFTDNDTTKVSNVVLWVETCNGNQVPLNAEYDENKGFWVASGTFGGWSDYDLPANVSLDFDCRTERVIDNEQLLSEYNSLLKVQEEIDSLSIAIDEIYRQIKEELKKDDIDFNAIDGLNEQLENLLGISNLPLEEDTKLDENELYNRLEIFKQEYGLVSIDSFLETNLTSIEYNIPDEFGAGNISVSSCDGYDLSVISEDSTYVKLNVSGNKHIYSKSSECEYILLDFEEDVCYNITFSSDSETNSAPTMLMRASANGVSQIQKHSNTIGEKIKVANELLNNLLRAIDNVVQHIDGGIKLARGGWRSSCSELSKLYALQEAGEYIAPNRFVLLELTCDGWQAEIKTLNGIKSALTNLRTQVLGKLFGTCGVISSFVDCRNDLDKFINLYYSVPQPCENDQKRSDDIRNSIIRAGAAAGIYYIANISADVCALLGIGPSIAAAPASGGSSLAVALAAVGKIAFSYGINAIYSNSCDMFVSNTQINISSLQCEKKEDDDDDGGNHKSNNPSSGNVHDPSGYVYEGVSSNRLEGVMASCYYKETVEDIYGDQHENIVLWDAEEYAQENPLFTDANGMYRWDVPKGLWQVKFEKEGYETTYSEWLPVPPPQLEVNIPMVQYKQPEVAGVHAYKDGVEIEFDKYMQPTTLNTDNIFVEKNGQKIAGVVMLVNEEQSYEGNAETYASKVRFVPEDAFFATDEVVLTVSRKVESYAGIPMQNDYTQEFDIEKEVKSLVADSIINVPYRRSKQMTISALPYDAAIGKTLVVKSSSSMIATVDADTLVMDENGQATITLTGELPGTSVMTFALADADVNGMSTIQVAIAEETITANPKASRISGTAVYRGTEVTLNCATEGAVIYYTLDGSCPCDWDAQLIYNAPIVIAEDSIVIKAMAVADGMYESDVVEYRYTLKKTTLGMSLNEGWNWVSHNVETPIAVTELETNALRIVGQAAELVNDPAYGFVGNLDSISPTKAYKVQVTEDTKYTLKGYEYDATTPIKLHAGWNWLGYPVSQVMSVNEAFANATPAEGDYIVGQDGFALYNEGAWIGTLLTLTPGKGYLYQAKNHYEFVYNTAIVSKAKALYSRSRVRKTPWSVNLYRYPNVMCVIADLYEDDVIAEMNRYIVGAFCENECRGIGKLVDGKVMMSIYGNNHEKITFRAMDIETGVTFDVSEELTFAETLHGTMKQSYPLHIMNDDTEISTQGWHIYLSVVSTTLYVSAEGNDDIDEITLTDVYGNTVLSLTQMKNPCSINLSHLTEGMYIVTVSEGSVTYNKKILKTTSD